MAPPFVEQRVVDEQGKHVPKDGKTVGEIVLRAPWLTMGYYGEQEKSEELWRHGWMHSGDMATIDSEESVLIIDRSKDVIKSGGEWISSLNPGKPYKHAPQGPGSGCVRSTVGKMGGERPVVLLVPGEKIQR